MSGCISLQYKSYGLQCKYNIKIKIWFHVHATQ